MNKEEFKKLMEPLSLEDLKKLKAYLECLQDSERSEETPSVSDC